MIDRGAAAGRGPETSTTSRWVTWPTIASGATRAPCATAPRPQARRSSQAPRRPPARRPASGCASWPGKRESAASRGTVVPVAALEWGSLAHGAVQGAIQGAVRGAVPGAVRGPVPGAAGHTRHFRLVAEVRPYTPPPAGACGRRITRVETGAYGCGRWWRWQWRERGVRPRVIAQSPGVLGESPRCLTPSRSTCAR